MRHTEKTFAAKIPVRVFVKKIILREYGQEPILLTQKSLLGKQVMNMPFDLPFEFSGDDAALEKCYGEPLEVQISHRLWRHFTQYKSLFQAGYFFEKMCQLMLLTHMRAQVRAGREAWGSMVDFMALYDIGEDDYPLESAYAVWKTYKREHPTMMVA